jgi:hypothetical protein
MIPLMSKKAVSKLPPGIELDPDAWPRFEQFVRDVAKAGPHHRAPKSKERSASKGRVRKGKSRA